MSKVFDDIKQGLEQALAYEKSEWILEEHEGYTIARCPACGKEAVTDEYTGKPIMSNYCPECGKELKSKTPISDSLVGVLSERAATYKVSRDEDGKIVIEDSDVLDLYELDGVEIDPGTGTPLLPGRPTECYGNGEHEGFDCCCDECDHYLACFPEYQKEVDEALEDLRDLKAAEQAMVEHEKDPKTYTFDEVLEELGITREELDALPDAELGLDGE